MTGELPFPCCPHCGCTGADAAGHHIPCSAGCNDVDPARPDIDDATAV